MGTIGGSHEFSLDLARPKRGGELTCNCEQGLLSLPLHGRDRDGIAGAGTSKKAGPGKHEDVPGVVMV